MNNKKGIALAILAAVLYAIGSPISKILLEYVPPTMMAAFLYIGAGIGMAIISLVRKFKKNNKTELSLTKKELPYTIAMIILDIIAPIFLMFGLKMTTAENVSLLNNFEIVSTALIAFIVFKESVSKRLWCGITLITIASVILSIEDFSSLKFSFGSIFVIIACICWGFENNCTKKIASKNPIQIVLLKGIFSGLGAFIIALIIGEKITVWWSVIVALCVGLIAYGFSIYFYVYAQRELGAAKTSAYYAIAPFVAVALSMIIFKNELTLNFIIALLIMILGAFVASSDKPFFKGKNNLLS
ncbi:MAG: DMT family transporter [Clostridia bacterium]